LAALIVARPDATLAELREALPTAAGLSTLWRAIDRLGVTVKKNGPPVPLQPMAACSSRAGVNTSWFLAKVAPPSLQRRRAGTRDKFRLAPRILASLREGKLRTSDLSLPAGARPCRERRLRLRFVPIHPAIGSGQQPFVRLTIFRKD